MRQRWPLTVLLVAAAAIALPAGAGADQSSQPASPLAGHISAGTSHSCAIVSAAVRCWGFAGNGRLGYADGANDIGDDEVPAAAGTVDLGAGRSAIAVSAGEGHTCALLDDHRLRCWGFGGNGRLGYGTTQDVGDDETPAAVTPVDVGPGRAVAAVSSGGAHTCALLDDGTVRCWGYAAAGQLGYGNDTDLHAPAGAIDLGAGRTAVAITAGVSHSCALLDNGAVRCWGYALFGQLGYGNATTIGDTETPGSVEPVDLGAGRSATAISAGSQHTCALLDDAKVRCWGYGGNGQLGYANTLSVGDDETPGSVGPVDVGAGRTATSISAGRQHTCATLDDASVRCWGGGTFGQLGYANQLPVTTPGPAGPVALGANRTASAIATGEYHTCALLDAGAVRCWGYGASGRLGYCNQRSIGDDETPAAAGPVDLGAGGAGCRVATPPPASPPPAPAPAAPQTPPVQDAGAAARRVEAARKRRFGTCMLAAAKRATRARRTRARRSCFRRHARTPSRVRRLRAKAPGRTRVVLTFEASGSDRRHAPTARAYLVKQSRRAIRRGRHFARAPALCRGFCRFSPAVVGTKLTLTVTGLRPRTTYYFAVAARDNVTRKRGPRSTTVRVRTR